MKMNRKELLRALQATKTVACRKTNLTITSCVLIDGENQCVRATDLETGVNVPLDISGCEHTVDGQTVHERMVVDHKIFLKAVSKLDGDDVDIVFEDTEVSKPSEGFFNNPLWANVNGEYHIMTMPADDYPDEPDIDWANETFLGEITKETMAFLLEIKPPSNDRRSHVNAVSFQDKRVTSTDGNRLHSANSMPYDGETILVPFDALRVVKTIGDAVAYIENKDGCHCRFECDDVTIITRTLDGGFPDFLPIIDCEGNDKYTLPKGALSKACNKALVMNSDVYKGMVVDISPDGFKTSATNPDCGEYHAATEIPIEDPVPSGECKMAVSPDFILAGLRHINSNSIYINGERHPIVISDDLKTAAIMPMRI